jgi:hypothetical protein
MPEMRHIPRGIRSLKPCSLIVPVLEDYTSLNDSIYLVINSTRDL